MLTLRCLNDTYEHIQNPSQGTQNAPQIPNVLPSFHSRYPPKPNKDPETNQVGPSKAHIETHLTSTELIRHGRVAKGRN